MSAQTNAAPSAAKRRAVAAPIFGRDGRVEAAVALLGPAVRMPRKRMTELARQVMATAGAISRELGYTATP